MMTGIDRFHCTKNKYIQVELSPEQEMDFYSRKLIMATVKVSRADMCGLTPLQVHERAIIGCVGKCMVKSIIGQTFV